jgi:hypothetical protein
MLDNGLDGLVLDFRGLSGNGALQNADTLWILLGNALDILRLPKGILLEPDLETCVEDGDERNRFLTTALRDREETCFVF